MVGYLRRRLVDLATVRALVVALPVAGAAVFLSGVIDDRMLKHAHRQRLLP